MIFTLADAALAGLAEMIIILLMVIVTLVESVVMVILKFNHFRKCLLDSFLVNLASLGTGYLVSGFYNISLGGDTYLSLLISFLITLIVEGILLLLLNKAKAVLKVWNTCLVMNAVTYAGFLVLFIIQHT